MAFEVPPLPYGYDALEPTIDEQTMQLHHDKHHQAYVDNANKALDGTPLDGQSVEQVLTNLDALPADKRRRRATMSAGTRTTRCSGRSWARTAAARPRARSAQAIDDTFGSVDELKAAGQRRRRQALRLGLELARPRRHRSRRHLDAEPGLADHGARRRPCSASTSGSTPTTSTTRTGARTTSPPGGTSSTGTRWRPGTKRLSGAEPVRLRTGAELRLTGTPHGSGEVVVCLNGGRAEPLEGTWGASVEWLVRRLAPRFPQLAFAEVRYRVRSWKRFELCVEDARAAVEETGGQRTLLLGYSMGGAVAITAADEPSVEGVLALAPWIPDELDLGALRGRRLDVLHGSFDRPLPGIPGVAPSGSRRGFERAQQLGVEGSYELVRGGLHAIAARPGGRLIPLPRAEGWAALVAERLDAFERR